MEGRPFIQNLLLFPWHSLRRKDNDRRNVGLKNLQSIINSAFVRNDYAQWGGGLLSLDPGCLQFSRQSEPNVVTLQTGVSDENGVTQLAKSVQVRSTGATAQIDLVNFKPGDYYLRITSACAWQVQLSPQE